MKVSINWLKELVDINKPLSELIELINLRTLGTKEVTDEFIELDMKGYNRADLLSLRGVAYELAAISGASTKFQEPSTKDYFWTGKNLPQTPVEIENANLASIQCVAKIEGLKVGESSSEWKEKLESSGMRPVNNIVDATNLIMIEYGQPLHAFDAATVEDDRINVRAAKENEEITTLDNKLRELDARDIVLADTKKALDVAGVMGGIDTEIKESTNTILLSASLFNPTLVRKTAHKLGLHSEASKRFYHGLTKKRLFQALDAAIKLYESLGGRLVSLNIVGDSEEESKKIPLSLSKVNALIGVEFINTEVEQYLGKLNFEIKAVAGGWVVTPPYYRLDVSIEEDVIEEVARMYGYEKIKPQPLPGNPPTPSDQSLFELLEKIRKKLVDSGLTEVQTYSFYSTAVLEALGFDEEAKEALIKVANPISSETEYMRQTNWANLVEALGKNLKQGIKDIAIFEVGKIYYQNEKNQIDEKFSLSIGLINGSDNPLNELISIYNKLDKDVNLGLEIDGQRREGQTKLGLFHPNRVVHLKKGDLIFGGLAEVHRRVLDKLGIKERVAILEIGLDKFLR